MNDSRNAATAALVLRVSLGTMFIAHALLKYFVFTLPGTAQFFASLGLPGVLGYATFAAELIGGILLIAGVATRAVSLALVPVLIGATWAHAGNGWLFTSPNGGWNTPRSGRWHSSCRRCSVTAPSRSARRRPGPAGSRPMRRPTLRIRRVSPILASIHRRNP
jgi:putative oxidoreductase